MKDPMRKKGENNLKVVVSNVEGKKKKKQQRKKGKKGHLKVEERRDRKKAEKCELSDR